MTQDGRCRRRRKALRGLALAGVVGLSLLAAACGGGSSAAKVAQIGTTNSANSSGSSSASGSSNPRAYSACMRSHGVSSFPDPDSGGRLLITPEGVSPNGQKNGVDMNSPEVRAAARACQKLLPNGGRPTAAQIANANQAMLKFARCMRAHGVSKFPDPKPGGEPVLGPKVGVNPNAPLFKAALQDLPEGRSLRRPDLWSPRPNTLTLRRQTTPNGLDLKIF
jgi:hypothetical protein